MPDVLLIQNRLHQLRDLSRRLTLEEEGTRAVNPEKARHLADAMADVAIAIARLEAVADGSALASVSLAPPGDRPHFDA